MLLRRLEKHPRMFFTLGLAALALGGLAHLFLRPGAGRPEGLVDGLTGFLYGVAIALLVINLVVNRRRPSRM